MMRTLYQTIGLVTLGLSLNVEAAPPDFSLCDGLTVQGGLRGMCYGYQASGCSFESEEQNCIQLEFVFREKALSLGQDIFMPGSQIPGRDCVLSELTCGVDNLSYTLEAPGLSGSVLTINCDMTISNAAAVCADFAADRCSLLGGMDDASLFLPQIEMDQAFCFPE